MEATVSPPLNLQHTMKPIKPSTAKQIKQKRLSIIISIMSHDNRRKLMFLTKLREPRIPQFTSRHFNADSPFASKVLSIKPLDKDPNS